MKRKKYLFFSLFLVLVFATLVLATDFEVYVYHYPSGNPVINADVAVEFSGGYRTSGRTDSNGLFEFHYTLGGTDSTWTSFARHDTLVFYHPVNGFVTTSTATLVHNHYLQDPE